MTTVLNILKEKLIERSREASITTNLFKFKETRGEKKMLKEMTKKRNNKKKGFTLAELVIVVAIVAILAGIAVLAFGKITETANMSTFEANHRSIVSAVALAAGEVDGDISRITQASIENQIKGKDGSQGIAGLQESPKGATYTLTVTSTDVVVRSEYKDGGGNVVKDLYYSAMATPKP